jgi:hypothetical protein
MGITLKDQFDGFLPEFEAPDKYAASVASPSRKVV